MNIPTIKLSNNISVPEIGFGTCKHALDRPIDDIISTAIETGYRYFDTASYYETERDLGNALKCSGLKRTEYQVASKLWYEELGYKNAKDALYRSLDRLGLDFLDFYLIHWPKASDNDENWKQTLVETWTALIELKEEGLVKSLGVSNFLPHHLEVIKQNSNEMPVLDQLEMHLGYFQEYAYRYLLENGIQPQAWSPIGRGKDLFKTNGIINKMAEKYNVSVQVLSLRYLVQRNVMPLPWSTNADHIKNNINIYGFEISEEDLSMLSCMPQQTWLGEHPDFNLPLAKHINMNQ